MKMVGGVLCYQIAQIWPGNTLQYNNLIAFRVVPDRGPELAGYIDIPVYIRQHTRFWYL